jgi:hypothetical protein
MLRKVFAANPSQAEFCVDRADGATGSIVAIGRQCLPATDTETALSILRFAAIQCVEGEQDLADLAPEDGFIPAEPVEREVGQRQEF